MIARTGGCVSQSASVPRGRPSCVTANERFAVRAAIRQRLAHAPHLGTRIRPARAGRIPCPTRLRRSGTTCLDQPLKSRLAPTPDRSLLGTAPRSVYLAPMPDAYDPDGLIVVVDLIQDSERTPMQ